MDPLQVGTPPPHSHQHPYLRQMESAVRHGEAVSRTLTALNSRTSATTNISMSWSPQDSITKSYRVTQTTIFPSGPKRVVTKDTASTSVTSTVAKGATLCTQVAALSTLKVIGAQSTNVCVLSN